MNILRRTRYALPLALALTLVGCAELLSAIETNPREAATPTDGLREALRVGTGRAVESLGRADGYLARADVRIPVPREFDRVKTALQVIGRGRVVDEFVTSMNRAAEGAAPLARSVFLDSIRSMTFDDAVAILRGNSHEATDFFRDRAGSRLREAFRPVVARQLDSVGATREFNELVDEINRLPFVQRPVFELDEYVTERALAGLFRVLAEEEQRIREDPAARTTELLRRFFGEAARF